MKLADLKISKEEEDQQDACSIFNSEDDDNLTEVLICLEESKELLSGLIDPLHNQKEKITPYFKREISKMIKASNAILDQYDMPALAGEEEEA